MDGVNEIIPNLDTMINGKQYTAGSWKVYFRQEGDLVYCLHQDSIQEEIVMDFNVAIGDTLYNLYSRDGWWNKYHARVIVVDSVLLGDGSFHTYIELEGFQMFDGYQWESHTWEIKWNEKGLCNCGGTYNVLGGLTTNTPLDYQILDGPYYVNPVYCTTDTLVPNECYDFGHTCSNCSPILSEVNENENSIINLYPNPASTQIYLESSLLGVQQLSIFSMTGKLIESVSFRGQYTLDVEHYTEGFYVYVCRDEFGNQTTGKIVVDR
ncbi:hypothetical protein CRYO30217_00903 [Parvicella tangerina]|uniref:Secretion system C-terminal sorting domain-containing protein n=2 Tax=Parvicella tangerina TaxID=2829795 RepID=A0A916JKP1_9FLAO|nr:hypothetical protein CRYO30217_00903 [Parvicella tangerina]